MDLDYDYLCKTVVVGDTGVGKSSLILRYSDSVFTTSHIATVGVDFKIRTVDMDGVRVKTQLWDTAGQERFHAIVASYYRGAHAIILVYDVNDIPSFDHLWVWLAEVRLHASPHAVVLVVGNKRDSPDQKLAVPENKAREWATSNGCEFIMTSARNNSNVDEAFDSLVHQFLESPVRHNKRKSPVQVKEPLLRQPCLIKGTKSCC